MPFAQGSRCIACVLEHIGDGITFGADDHSGVTGSDVRTRPAPCIFSGKQGIAGRSTGCSRCMCIRKADTTVCQFVYVWRLYAGSSVAFQVAVTEVVSIDKDDIRGLWSRLPLLGFQ